MNRNEGTAPGRFFRLATLTILVAAGGFLAACDDDVTGPEARGNVQILLTDAPSEMLDSAHVWISHVYLVGGEDDDTLGGGSGPDGRVDLYHDPGNPHRLDLLRLRDGVTADLTGEVAVEAGDYAQLRLVVDSARVTLTEGITFEDGSRAAALFVPSGAQSGIKVQLDGAVDVDAGETLVLTVDADVDRNFVIQMHPPTGNVRRVLFTPVLTELGRQEESGG